jgi:hypothetical protein
MKKFRIVLIYIWAVILVLLVPVMFFTFGSGLPEKVGRKLPLKEGTFNQGNGSLQSDRAVAK